MDNILVIHPNWLGDVIFSTPFIRNLKRAYPDGAITSFVVPRTHPVLMNNPYIGEVILYDEDGAEASLGGKASFVRELRGRQFETVFFLRPSLTRTALAVFAGIPERIGFDTSKSGWLLTRRISYPEEPVHRADMYLELLRQLGIAADGKGCDFFVTEREIERARALLRDSGVAEGESFCVMHAGANWSLKRWPVASFARLADRVADETGLQVIFTGAATDRIRTEEIIARATRRPVSLAGKTTLGEVGALFTLSACMVSADSGPMHIACALGVPVVALFGPTHTDITGPYHPRHPNTVVLRNEIECNSEPCYDLDCPKNRCMEAIAVNDVLAAIKRLIKGGAASCNE
ncbi:MAG: lipopolysaccharide heptosyltransferase II [Candidatus Omnitrophica bacterium]|nr:lipopolysaccharide heptosyltransferase II [Candidatus Omnitrophota bacterium]